MQASQHFDGQTLGVPTMVRDRGDLGIKTGLSRAIAAVANFAEDLFILGQFAFGREYVALPQAQGQATLLIQNL